MKCSASQISIEDLMSLRQCSSPTLRVTRKGVKKREDERMSLLWKHSESM